MTELESKTDELVRLAMLLREFCPVNQPARDVMGRTHMRAAVDFSRDDVQTCVFGIVYAADELAKAGWRSPLMP